MHRLNKVISNAGICSRRAADELIKAGRVAINGQIIIELATKIIGSEEIKVDDKIINTDNKTRLWTYYKPIGLLTTNSDPLNRPTIFDNLKGLPRVISIGRLDFNSEGLLLLTNNGDLSRKFELPVNRILRIYKVRSYGKLDKLLPYLDKKFSLKIKDIVYHVEKIESATKLAESSKWFIVSLYEGKNREIRKIFEHFGLQVNRLIRINYGPFSLGNMKAGQYLEQDYTTFQEFLTK